MRFFAVAAAVLLLFSGASAEETPGPTAVRQYTSDWLRVEATASTAEEKAQALVALCDLYAAIRVHPLYAHSEMLRGEATRVRRRLLTASRQLTGQLDRAHLPRPAELGNRVDAALASAASAGTSSPDNQTDASLAGGPGPGAVSDSGWQLVELIQRTVHPDFWDNTGGPGSIRYFAIKRVLVVRATTEVHEDLAALLRQLSP
ncbi:MAG: hypothetical protein ACO1RT_00060 [Planctomycetaceae bacterium]